MKRNLKNLLPDSIVNIQMYKDYEQKVNKNNFLELINDNDIKTMLLKNKLNFDVLSNAFEKSLEKELLEKFKIKLPIMFYESYEIDMCIYEDTVIFYDALHIALCLLLNSYILWKENFKNLSKGYYKKLQNNIIFDSSKIRLKSLTLKQYSYILINNVNEKKLDFLNFYKFDRVTECLVFFFLHEYAHLKHPDIKDELEVDNIAISWFLKQYSNDVLIYPYIFFRFMSQFDKNLKERVLNLSKYIKKTEEVNQFFQEIK